MAESECFRNSPVVVFACHCRHKRGSNRSRDPTRCFLWPGLRNHPPRRVELLRCLFAAWKRARDRGTKPCFDWGWREGVYAYASEKGWRNTRAIFRDFWGLGDLLFVVKCDSWLRYFRDQRRNFVAVFKLCIKLYKLSRLKLTEKIFFCKKKLIDMKKLLYGNWFLWWMVIEICGGRDLKIKIIFFKFYFSIQNWQMLRRMIISYYFV